MIAVETESGERLPPMSCQRRGNLVSVTHASATFTVADFAPAGVRSSPIETALPVSVATMTKQFDGEIRGRSATLFTAAYDESADTGTYLAMESFQGTVQGRSGSFNFAHSATTCGEGRRNEFFLVVPGSGTNELAGISGSGAVAIDADGTHRIWLDYDLDRQLRLRSHCWLAGHASLSGGNARGLWRQAKSARARPRRVWRSWH
jgi:hypothetical protein